MSKLSGYSSDYAPRRGRSDLFEDPEARRHNPAFAGAVERMNAPERMRGMQQVSNDYDFGLGDEDSYVNDVVGEEPKDKPVPQLDDKAVGFWEKAAQFLGDEPIEMKVNNGGGGIDAAIAILLGIGNAYARSAGERRAKRIALQKQGIEKVEKENEQADIDRRQYRTAQRAARSSYRRERHAAADKERERIRKDNERDQTTVVDPVSGKRFPVTSEAGLRLANPALAAKTYDSRGSGGAGGADGEKPDLAGITTRRADEAESEFKDYRGAIVRNRATQQEPRWQMFGSNPENFAKMTPAAEDSIRRGLPPAGVDPQTAELYRGAARSHAKFRISRYAQDFNAARDPRTLQQLVRRAASEGLDVNDNDFVDAYIAAKERLGGAPR